METISIPLSPTKGEIESFEQDDRNILNVRVQNPAGEMIDGSGYRVEIKLSKDAMIGLGTELIRAAHRESAETRVWHLRPPDENLASRVLGVYLHPVSCELIIAGANFDTLESLLKQATQSS